MGLNLFIFIMSSIIFSLILWADISQEKYPIILKIILGIILLLCGVVCLSYMFITFLYFSRFLVDLLFISYPICMNTFLGIHTFLI